MYYTVQKITNLANSKIYVGVHKTNNLDDDYMGSGKLIKRAIEKYGIESFKKEILEVFDNAEDMFNMESTIVNEEFVRRENVYNIKEGGNGGFDHINDSSKEHIMRTKRSGSLGGKSTSTSRKLDPKRFIKSDSKRSLKMKKLHLDGKVKYDNFLNKTHSEETKKQMSDSHKGKHDGSKNSQFGTMWIHSLTEKVSKKIKKEELPNYENLGWLKGRKMKF